MSTIDVVGKQPSVLEAIEAVKCAVKQGFLLEYFLLNCPLLHCITGHEPSRKIIKIFDIAKSYFVLLTAHTALSESILSHMSVRTRNIFTLYLLQFPSEKIDKFKSSHLHVS